MVLCVRLHEAGVNHTTLLIKRAKHIKKNEFEIKYLCGQGYVELAGLYKLTQLQTTGHFALRLMIKYI